MPLLGGLFGRKHKAATRSTNAPATDADSALSSPTNSYVTTDKSLPSSPNGRSILNSDSGNRSPNHHHLSSAPAASSKLRLPFSRKKSRAPIEDPVPTLPNNRLLRPPRLSYGAYDSDSGDARPLCPPPPKSAMFATYTDPNSALSTRSLPNDSIPSASHRQHKEKRPSFFHWSKDSASSKPLPDPKAPINLNSPPPESDSSFNLKSFRHLRPPSPNASNSSLAVPSPRPRKSSVNSESSQRISVAAFREVHARRSAAGSPSPSFRSPSPTSPFPLDGQRGRTSSRPPSQAINQRRSTNLAVGYTSDSDESTSSDEEDSDDGLHNRRNDATRNRAVRPQVGKRQAKSEIGHPGSGHSTKQQSGFTATQSHNGHGDPDQHVRQSCVGNTPNYPIEQASRPPSDLAVNGTRRRVSNSTSALSPSAAAKRASVLANANAALDQDPLVALKQTNRHVRDSSTVSNPSQIARALKNSVDTDSESEEDNAPLACLVPPRRPGSSMSSASNTSLKTNGTRGPNGRAMSKPLIDINALTTKKPTIGPQKSNDDAFTGIGLIAGQMHGSHNALIESPTSVDYPSSRSPLTSKSPPGSTHFIRPLSPSKEMKAHLNMDNKSSSSPPSVSKVEKSPSPERRRDVLTERLAKLAKANVNADELGTKLKKKSQSPPPPSTRPELTLGRSFATTLPIVNSKPSPPDDQLIQDVDQDILKLISRMGEPEENETPEARPKQEENEKSSDSESDAYGEPEHNKRQQEKVDAKLKDSPKFPLTPGPEPEDKNRIAPIPIKQRAPAPSFSVMSRPPIQRPQEDDNRSSSTTFTTASTTANAINSGRGSSRPDSATSRATNAKAGLSNMRSSTNLASTSSTSQPIPSSTVTQRQRSSTMIPSSISPPSFGTSTSSFARLAAREGSVVPSSTHTPSSASISSPSGSGNALKTPNANKAAVLKTVTSTNPDSVSSRDVQSPPMNSSPASRHRSSTMGSIMPDQTLSRPANSSPVPAMPVKPFAMRRDSPASSTGDSSSGRAPLTPGDGSDVSAPKKAAGKGKGREEWGSGVSGLGPPSTKSATSGHGHGGPRRVKRRSVSFEDEIRDATVASSSARKSRETDSDDSEARRRDRRRSEAKAAIELGNVINGPGPVVSDDEDDLPANQVMNAARMSTINPMMGMGTPMQMPFNGSPAAWGGNMSPWPQQARPQMLSPPPFMISPPPEPNFYAAHHQAMMYAKQAYQMAVAQQAMAAAADEWERNSVMGGSVYGGGSNASVMMSSPQYGMMGMGGMNNGWSTGSMIFPSSTQSAYGGRGGIGSSRSEYGGGGGGGGKWSSARSSYGESFGPSDRLRPGMAAGGGNRHSRDSGYYPPVPPIPQNHGGRSSPAKGRNRTTSGPAVAAREGQRKPPPSSWRAGV